MFKSTLIALVYEIVRFLKQHASFFTENEAAREKSLESLKLPAAFQNYLKKTSKEQFFKDMALIVKFIHHPQENVIKDNGFFMALATFLNSAFGLRLDILMSVQRLSEKEQQNVIEKSIPSNNPVATSLKKLMNRYSYQELATEIALLNQRVADGPYIVIQSPREIDIELKKEMREALLKENPMSFPIFQINRKLIGGFRIFKAGENIDHSWMARVLRFTSLTNSV